MRVKLRPSQAATPLLDALNSCGVAVEVSSAFRRAAWCLGTASAPALGVAISARPPWSVAATGRSFRSSAQGLGKPKVAVADPPEGWRWGSDQKKNARIYNCERSAWRKEMAWLRKKWASVVVEHNKKVHLRHLCFRLCGACHVEPTM
jgi:hypothetical protein